MDHVHEHNGIERAAWAALRIIAGASFMTHGLQKLFGMWGGPMGNGQGVAPFSWPFGFAGIIELVCGFLILIGLFTRIAAFLASGEMAVAYFMMHVPNQGHPNILPIVNHGEVVVLFCFIFLFFAVFGPGAFSVDAMMHRNRADRMSHLPSGPAPERARDQVGG